MLLTMTTDVTLVPLTCPTCGTAFAIEKVRHGQLRELREAFYCPNGHSLSFKGEQEADKLRRELMQERQRLDQARADAKYQREQKERMVRRLSAAKGQMTRVKHRIARGVCPCCGRTFPNLAAHMKTKHPDYEYTEIDENGKLVKALPGPGESTAK